MSQYLVCIEPKDYAASDTDTQQFASAMAQQGFFTVVSTSNGACCLPRNHFIKLGDYSLEDIEKAVAKAVDRPANILIVQYFIMRQRCSDHA